MYAILINTKLKVERSPRMCEIGGSIPGQDTLKQVVTVLLPNAQEQV